MKYYAIIGKDGYCTHIMNGDEPPQLDNLCIVELEDTEDMEYYLNRYYDIENGIWKDEQYFPTVVPKPLTEHEQAMLDTRESVETSSFDNLINMDMLLGLDEKLNKIMEHLGIQI